MDLYEIEGMARAFHRAENPAAYIASVWPDLTAEQGARLLESIGKLEQQPDTND